MNLTQLKEGQKAIITTVNEETVPLKLIDMGCFPGNDVELVQVAPLGDPIYYCINGTHLCIRKELATEINIELV